MDYKNLIVKTIANSGLADYAKETLDKQVGMTRDDLDKVIERAASLDIPVEELIFLISKHYSDTHVHFLDEDITDLDCVDIEAVTDD
jgi:DNA-binding transcriptional regulator YhcF (GntR family)